MVTESGIVPLDLRVIMHLKMAEVRHFCGVSLAKAIKGIDIPHTILSLVPTKDNINNIG